MRRQKGLEQGMDDVQDEVPEVRLAGNLLLKGVPKFLQCGCFARLSFRGGQSYNKLLLCHEGKSQTILWLATSQKNRHHDDLDVDVFYRIINATESINHINKKKIAPPNQYSE